ncbi:hypothetical protein EDC01DRAFT_676778 [Geopyxis carbonaria]|nr:hypothetical protein EDC01DRAFT_676778 [Geopyxis carbonaria]
MTKSWEREKDRMFELYMVRGMKLTDLQRIMAEQYGFEASERSYKQKFKDWQWFKKTPRGESSYAASNEGYSSNEGDYTYSDVSTSRGVSRRTNTSTAFEEPLYDHYSEPVAYDPALYSHPIVTAAPVAGPSYAAWDPTVDPIGGVIPQVTNPHWAQSRSQFKHLLRDAERSVDHGQYDQGERALGEALRQVQWMKAQAGSQ